MKPRGYGHDIGDDGSETLAEATIHDDGTTEIRIVTWLGREPEQARATDTTDPDAG